MPTSCACHVIKPKRISFLSSVLPVYFTESSKFLSTRPDGKPITSLDMDWLYNKLADGHWSMNLAPNTSIHIKLASMIPLGRGHRRSISLPKRLKTSYYFHEYVGFELPLVRCYRPQPSLYFPCTQKWVYKQNWGQQINKEKSHQSLMI